MAGYEALRLEGFAEFRRALKDAGDEFPKELRKANLTVAQQVADKTRSSFSGRAGVAPKLAGTVKASGQQTGASIRIGGAAHPYTFGAEFGGGRRPTTQQFEPWRGSGATAGYSLYPTLRSERQHIEDTYLDAIDQVAKRAFPE